MLAVVDMLFLNEWAVFPLTKTAKEAAKNRELIAKQSEQVIPANSEEAAEREEPADKTDDGSDGEE